MLTEEEKNFITYWEKNRNRKKRLIWQFAAGLPLGVAMSVAIVFNYLSGWYKRATMQLNVSSSGILVVLLGIILIIVFMVVFSSRHRWEMNEQRYRELKSRKDI
ncbi:MAG: hypothetical protein JNM88_14125 [Chitinophagaceae bacterium]|nr:hypothetical protein [Chitinophagaceae bacterium]